MVKAAESFQRAAELLPGFAPAWANLGGTLGELDRPEEALAAFERALAIDPSSPQALNNVGVVRRELGRLAESEAAFRQVIQLTPGMAFGHYNLGHTLFLQGRFNAALSAYVEGQARDPEKNPVQASRLALCKVATGDEAGALRELQRATNGLPREYRQQLLADTGAILWALVTQHPELVGWQPVQAWVSAELGKLMRYAQFIFDRGVRLAAGLAVVVAIPMAVLFYFQFKSLNDIEETSAVVLRQLSSDTAESLTRAVEDYLKRPHISVLLRIPQAQNRTARPRVDRSDLPRRVEGEPVRRVVLHLDRGRAARQYRGWSTTRPAPPSRPARSTSGSGRIPVIGAALLPRLRELMKLRMAIVAFTQDINGRKHYVQAQLRWEGPARDRMTSVIAFAVDAEKLRTQLIPSVLRDWLASVQQPSGFPHLETEVLDEDGAAHLRLAPRTHGQRHARRRTQLRDHLLRQGAAGVRGAVRAAPRNLGPAHQLRAAADYRRS